MSTPAQGRLQLPGTVLAVGREGAAVRGRCRCAVLAVVVVVATACAGAAADDPSPLAAWPGTVAAIGDSITTAAFPDREHLASDNPALSWATGADDVASHRARIAVHEPRVTGVNVAVAGARIADAPRQADEAAAAGADYVTFLLGANDLCAAEPPSAERFGTVVRDALGRLGTRLPDAYVFVVSIPDVVHLRELLGSDIRAVTTWQRTGACPAVLGAQPTTGDLAAVRDLHAAYNDALVTACDEHPRCRHDGGAVAAHRFSADEVSSVDFFHPSVAGQRRLAELTWGAAFGG